MKLPPKLSSNVTDAQALNPPSLQCEAPVAGSISSHAEGSSFGLPCFLQPNMKEACDDFDFKIPCGDVLIKVGDVQIYSGEEIVCDRVNLSGARFKTKAGQIHLSYSAERGQIIKNLSLKNGGEEQTTEMKNKNTENKIGKIDFATQQLQSGKFTKKQVAAMLVKEYGCKVSSSVTTANWCASMSLERTGKPSKHLPEPKRKLPVKK